VFEYFLKAALSFLRTSTMVTWCT